MLCTPVSGDESRKTEQPHKIGIIVKNSRAKNKESTANNGGKEIDICLALSGPLENTARIVLNDQFRSSDG